MACSVCGSACVTALLRRGEQVGVGQIELAAEVEAARAAFLSSALAARGRSRRGVRCRRAGGVRAGAACAARRASRAAGRGAGGGAARFLFAVRGASSPRRSRWRVACVARRRRRRGARLARRSSRLRRGPGTPSRWRAMPPMAQTMPVSMCGNGRPGIEARPAMKPATPSPNKPPKPVASGQPSGVGIVGCGGGEQQNAERATTPTRRLSMRATSWRRMMRITPAARSARHRKRRGGAESLDGEIGEHRARAAEQIVRRRRRRRC